MGQKHTGLLTTTTDTAIKKIAVKDSTGIGLLMLPVSPDFTIEHVQNGSGAQDDIQDITLEPSATEGTWSLRVLGKTTDLLNRNISAAGLQAKIVAKGITDVTASGGPLGTAAIRLTRTLNFMPKVTIVANTLLSKPIKWIPTLTQTKFTEAVSASLYTQTPMWNVQALFLTGSPDAGTTTFNVTYNTPQTTGPIGPNATAADLRTALGLTTLNASNYEVYGGPWPEKPFVILFKNELQYQQQIKFTVGANSFNNSGLPVIWPIGKQILVSYHDALKQHIVVRPGYV